MTTRANELERFKREINLSEYAASQGYELDRRASSRNSATMANAAGDKIVIARGRDEHWMYFSVRDPSDCGSIIDFVTHRRRINLGEVRIELRPWLGTSRPRASTRDYAPLLEPVSRDMAAVRAAYEATRPLVEGGHAYLNSRGLSPSLLSLPLFADRIRVDARANAVFPHFNRDGLCGFELKNVSFTGFAKHGAKGLWTSHFDRGDRRLVIAESAIDALSYFALSPSDATRLVSSAGQFSPEQHEFVQSAMAKMPPDATIVLALDNDAGGDQLTSVLTAAFAKLARKDLSLVDHRPTQRGMDWNDVLTALPQGPTIEP